MNGKRSQFTVMNDIMMNDTANDKKDRKVCRCCCRCSINTEIGNNAAGRKRRRFRFSINEP